MALSQKEFIIGCLIGGILGASVALVAPKAFLEENTRHHHHKAHKKSKRRKVAKKHKVAH